MSRGIIKIKFFICILVMLIFSNIFVTYASNTYYINGVHVSCDDFSSSKNECWVYANSIYKKIWGKNFNNRFDDVDNSLRNLSDDQLRLTPEHLKNYVTNAEIGSCLRICNSQYLHGSDGWGHSQIIVQKDSNGFTVLQGGLSAPPYKNERYYTWNEYCNTSWLGGQYDYIKYIKWPNSTSNNAVPNLSGSTPRGYLDSVSADNKTITLRGWAFDSDDLNSALEIHVYIGGPVGSSNAEGVGNIRANIYRPDLEINGFPGVGKYHGFDCTIQTTKTGWQDVYVYAINVGQSGTNPNIGHKRVYIPDKKPVCKDPSVNFEDITGGKEIKINSADANETVHYDIKKDGQSYRSGTFQGSYSLLLKECGTFQVTAYATRANYDQSQTVVINKTVSRVANPAINLNAGTDGFLVNILDATSGAAIYYTTSGNTPSVSSIKYTGPFEINSDKTIKAIAVKKGFVDSEVVTKNVELKVPEEPTGLTMDNDAQVAEGTQITIKWDEIPMAASYTVVLYKNEEIVSKETVNVNQAVLLMKEAGKYQVGVYGSNFVGNGSESKKRVDIEVMAPVKVEFKDWDGSVIETETITWGTDASLPPNPERRGYTFSKWENEDKITKVKEDLVVTAVYKINSYLVKFYDASERQVGNTQVVNFGSAAVSPEAELKDIPTGYVFAGWRVFEMENDCTGDYLCVDGDMKLQAVYCWENMDIPTVCEITDAKRNSETGNYNISFKVTNYPEKSTTAMARVSLLTSEGKLVKSGKIELEIGADGTAEKTMTLKYSGSAVKTSVVILGMDGDYLTDSAYSKIAESDIEEQAGFIWDSWSEWSTTPIQETEDVDVETMTQYRYADKEFTTSSSSNMAGWTCYNTETVYGEWGGWYGWIEQQAPAASDTCQVEVSRFWRYYYLKCPNCGGEEGLYGTSDCGWKSLNSSHMVVGWSRTPYSATGYHIYPYAAWKGVTNSNSLIQENIAGYNGITPGHTWYFNAPDESKQDVGAISGDSNDIIIRAFSRWRTRSKSLKYYYYKWGSFSDWSDQEVVGSDDRKVETRTLYRKREKLPNYTTIVPGTEEKSIFYDFTGSIKTDVDLSGKLATIMVYKGKNVDPNEDQIQYIGQTIIGDENTYKFTVNLKTEPTTFTGDFTVCLGIEGSTGLVNVDVIPYEKPVYQIIYADDNGKQLSVQYVKEGENGQPPASPVKEGYYFTGWDSNASNVQREMTITAQYEPKEYVVIFVDEVSGITTFGVFNYGDVIVAPDVCDTEGHTFVGWDMILEGKNTVTDNMIVRAVYDTKSFVVDFVDENGTIISSQNISYGEAAVPPAALDVKDMEFLGWNTEKSWWNVCENMTIHPILAYQETVTAPAWHIEELNEQVKIYLDSDMEDAKIYYTLDGSEPTENSQLYEDEVCIGYEKSFNESMEVTEKKYTIQLKAIAVQDDMNNSEVVSVDCSNVLEVDPSESRFYEITLDVNGGHALEKSVLNLQNNALYGSLPIPEHDEYKFKGWYSAASGGTKITETTKLIEASNHTLYAQWQEDSQGDITLLSISDCNVTINEESFEYTGSEIKPIVTVKDDAKILIKDVDYRLEFDNNIEVGSGTVKVIGMGDYEGIVLLQFTIVESSGSTSKPDIQPVYEVFEDISNTDWFNDYVQYVYDNGIMTGLDKSHFGPYGSLSRAQFALILYRMEGEPRFETWKSFKDIAGGEWYGPAVLWAAENGIVTGYENGYFGPTDLITREQMALMMYRYANFKKYDTEGKADFDTFKDASKVSGFAQEALRWAVGNNIITGKENGTMLDPQGNASRAECATIINRFLNVYR